MNMRYIARAEKPPTRFDAPTRRNLLALGLFWVFVLASIGLITWMLMQDTGEKPMVCDHNVARSFNSFGNCSQ